MNERFIRISYTIIFGITLIISIITLGISASLVSKYNKDGYPPEHTGAYRDRIRLLLVASVWTTFFAREYSTDTAAIWRQRRFGCGGTDGDGRIRGMGDDGCVCPVAMEVGLRRLCAPCADVQEKAGRSWASAVGGESGVLRRVAEARRLTPLSPLPAACGSTLGLLDIAMPLFASSDASLYAPPSLLGVASSTSVARRSPLYSTLARQMLTPQSSSRSASSSSATARSGAFSRTWSGSSSASSCT